MNTLIDSAFNCLISIVVQMISLPFFSCNTSMSRTKNLTLDINAKKHTGNLPVCFNLTMHQISFSPYLSQQQWLAKIALTQSAGTCL